VGGELAFVPELDDARRHGSGKTPILIQ